MAASDFKRGLRKLGIRRAHIAAARMQIERTLIARHHQHRDAGHGRILCYHSVGTPLWGVNDVSAKRFGRHLEVALGAGYRFVPALDIAQTGGTERDLAVTFDDGLSSVITNAVPMLAALGIPWTLFVVTDWADGHHAFGDGVVLGWREIELAAAYGAVIGSHSVTHPRFRRLTRDEAEYELVHSRYLIEARTGIRVKEFAIPFGQSGDWSAEQAGLARAAGYEFVYAQSELRRPENTIARTFITRYDDDRTFRAALGGAFNGWEEWA